MWHVAQSKQLSEELSSTEPSLLVSIPWFILLKLSLICLHKAPQEQPRSQPPARATALSSPRPQLRHLSQEREVQNHNRGLCQTTTGTNVIKLFPP